MRRIAAVVHVFAEAIPDYAAMFSAQLSSVALWPPQACHVEFQVWTAETDQLTHRVVAAFQQHFRQRHTPATVIARNLPKRELFRRSIGRNISAKECTADVMWFADADYLCGGGCLDAMSAVDWQAILPAEMVFPKHYMMMHSHEIGDMEIDCIRPGNLQRPNIDAACYFKKRLKMGIGGLQIVPKHIALRGYCDGSKKWCSPRKNEKPFPDTDDDRVYRGSIHSSVPADIPNLFRMRHTSCSYETAEQRRQRMNAKRRLGSERT